MICPELVEGRICFRRTIFFIVCSLGQRVVQYFVETGTDKLLTDNDLYMQYATAGKERIATMFTSEKSNAQANTIFNEILE